MSTYLPSTLVLTAAALALAAEAGEPTQLSPAAVAPSLTGNQSTNLRVPAVTVSVGVAGNLCIVQSVKVSGQLKVPCTTVVQYLTDTLHLQRGTYVQTTFDDAAVQDFKDLRPLRSAISLDRALKAAHFKIDEKVGFITEPAKP